MVKVFIFGFVFGVVIAISLPATAQVAFSLASNARDDAARANRRLDSLEALLKVDCTKTKTIKTGGFWTERVEVEGYCVRRP